MRRPRVTARKFFKAWCENTKRRQNELLKAWDLSKVYTKKIVGHHDSIIAEVGCSLKLSCYPKDYYSIDAILYADEDIVEGLSNDILWFKGARVAFEHENAFNFNLFQEVAHLLLINCELRVLVVYPTYKDERNDEVFGYLNEIINSTRDSRTIASNESFLIIQGFKDGKELSWKGITFKEGYWKELRFNKTKNLG